MKNPSFPGIDISDNYFNKYNSSLLQSCKLIGAVTGNWNFQPLIIFGRLRGRGRTKKYWDAANNAKPQGIASNKGAFKKRPFLRAKNMGAWLSVRGTMITGKVLSAKEI